MNNALFQSNAGLFVAANTKQSLPVSAEASEALELLYKKMVNQNGGTITAIHWWMFRPRHEGAYEYASFDLKPVNGNSSVLNICIAGKTDIPVFAEDGSEIEVKEAVDAFYLCVYLLGKAVAEFGLKQFEVADGGLLFSSGSI